MNCDKQCQSPLTYLNIMHVYGCFLRYLLELREATAGRTQLGDDSPSWEVTQCACVCASHDVAKRKKNTTQVSYGCAARFQFEILLECIKANSFMAN